MKFFLSLLTSAFLSLVALAEDVPMKIESCSANTPLNTLCREDILALHPGQFSLGYREVKQKSEKFSKMTADELEIYLSKNPVPVVRGPGGEILITDHHHHSAGLLALGIKTTLLKFVVDYSDLSTAEYHRELVSHNFVFLFDENGTKRNIEELPTRIDAMPDDVYRSLAKFVALAGGFNDDAVLFCEFFWAQYFRQHIELKKEDSDVVFNSAVTRGVELAHSQDAKDLPGWLGNK